MRKSLIVATLPLALGGCLPQNLGVESQHKPIVADGRATVPNCPDWSSQGVDSAAGTDSNFGCATNGNLAAMVADPQDLVHGAAAAPGASSDIAPRAIGVWRNRARTGSAGGSGSSSGMSGGGGDSRGTNP